MSAKVNLYCCGGTGINIGKHFDKFRDKPVEGFASIQPMYVDTSKSNSRDVNEQHVYHLEGLDGNGKLRSQNTQAITDSVLSILNQFKPTEFNIVLHSAGGGSGSTIGPTIVSELLSRDVAVFVIMVGSTESVIELNNTIKTIKTYEAISRVRKKPVAVSYFENGSGLASRNTINQDVRSMITLMSLLLSKQNAEMDTADIKNWLNYHLVTSYQPKLTLLTVDTTEFDTMKDVEAASVATISTDSLDTTYPTMVEYHTVGFVSDDIFKDINRTKAIHLAMLYNAWDKIHSNLKTAMDEVNAKQAARVSRSNILSKEDEMTDNGLVF